MIRRPPRSTQSRSSAASDVYKRQGLAAEIVVGTTPGGVLGGTWGSPTLDDGTVSTSKLSTYNSPVAEQVLAYNSTYGLVWRDVVTVQTLATTGTYSMNTLSGEKATIAAMTGDIILTITNLADGHEVLIEVINGSTSRTLNINGSTGYTTEKVMGTNTVIDATISSHTTVVYWRTGSTLYYGFIYAN